MYVMIGFLLRVLAEIKAASLIRYLSGAGRVAFCILCSGATGVNAADWTPGNSPLFSRWARTVSPTNVWPEYPRPQMVRTEWLNLNGVWEYAFSEASANRPTSFNGQILVPFPVESGLSGVAQPLKPNGKLWYHRRFQVPKSWQGQRVWLNFGGVDWRCAVWVNQKLVGEHQGGYDAFSFNITPALNATGDQDILVCVTDPRRRQGPESRNAEAHPRHLRVFL